VINAVVKNSLSRLRFRIKTVPQSSHVSVWNAYTDPDAINMDESQFFIERHKLSRSQLRTLKKRPMFRANVIEDVIDMGENYVKKYWEDDLSDYQTDTGVNRFEVLEYWGIVDREMLEDNNVQMLRSDGVAKYYEGEINNLELSISNNICLFKI
jgi:hypothetical protein